jgi:hypothetical protein
VQLEGVLIVGDREGAKGIFLDCTLERKLSLGFAPAATVRTLSLRLLVHLVCHCLRGLAVHGRSDEGAHVPAVAEQVLRHVERLFACVLGVVQLFMLEGLLRGTAGELGTGHALAIFSLLVQYAVFSWHA